MIGNQNLPFNPQIKKTSTKGKLTSLGTILQADPDFEVLNLNFETEEQSKEFVLQYREIVFQRLAHELGATYKIPKENFGHHTIFSEYGFCITCRPDPFRNMKYFLQLQLHGSFYAYRSPIKRRENLLKKIREVIYLETNGWKLLQKTSRLDIAEFLLTDLSVEQVAEHFLNENTVLKFKPIIRKFYNKDHKELTGFSISSKSGSYRFICYDKKLEISDRARNPDYQKYINNIVESSSYKNLIRLELRVTDKQVQQYEKTMVSGEENIDQKLTEILKNTLNRFYSYHKIDGSTSWKEALFDENTKTICRNSKSKEQVRPKNFRDNPKEKTLRALQSFITKASITKSEMESLLSEIIFKNEETIREEIEITLEAHERYLRACYADLLSESVIQEEMAFARRVLHRKYPPPDNNIAA